MQQININELKPHPRNSEFFDDMEGDKWQEFVESIKSRGIIEPIVITPDKMIVSGHQRVRAAKELGIKTVMCDVHTYNSDDEILQDLLETNIRQRGDIGGSAQKVGKRIKELERIYGIHRGGDRGNQYTESKPNNSDLTKSQSDIASLLGISVDTLQNYKMMAEMIPELEELINTGIVTKTTALAMMKNLSPKEQEELISSLDTTKRITGKEVQKYIDELKKAQDEADRYRKSCENIAQKYDTERHEAADLRKQLENLKNSSSSESFQEKLKGSAILYCTRISKFIEEIGGYIWLTDHINELPDTEKRAYLRATQRIGEWYETMKYNLSGKAEGIE